jgi:hypothetical protein
MYNPLMKGNRRIDIRTSSCLITQPFFITTPVCLPPFSPNQNISVPTGGEGSGSRLRYSIPATEAVLVGRK